MNGGYCVRGNPVNNITQLNVTRPIVYNPGNNINLTLRLFLCFSYNISVGFPNASNFRTIFGQDSFYPMNSFNSRYSQIYPQSLIRDDENCVLFGAMGPTEETIDVNTTDAPPGYQVSAFFIDESNKTRGSKNGYLCDLQTSKPITLIDSSQMCRNLNNWSTSLNNQAISPGLIEQLVPFTVKHYTKGIDEEAWFSFNQTELFNSNFYSPDPRSIHDATRRAGIYPKCANSKCEGRNFIDHNTHTLTGPIHDKIYRAQLMLDISCLLLKKYNNSCDCVSTRNI